MARALRSTRQSRSPWCVEGRMESRSPKDRGAGSVGNSFAGQKNPRRPPEETQDRRATVHSALQSAECPRRVEERPRAREAKKRKASVQPRPSSGLKRTAAARETGKSEGKVITASHAPLYCHQLGVRDPLRWAGYALHGKPRVAAAHHRRPEPLHAHSGVDFCCTQGRKACQIQSIQAS